MSHDKQQFEVSVMTTKAENDLGHPTLQFCVLEGILISHVPNGCCT